MIVNIHNGRSMNSDCIQFDDIISTEKHMLFLWKHHCALFDKLRFSLSGMLQSLYRLFAMLVMPLIRSKTANFLSIVRKNVHWFFRPSMNMVKAAAEEWIVCIRMKRLLLMLLCTFFTTGTRCYSLDAALYCKIDRTLAYIFRDYWGLVVMNERMEFVFLDALLNTWRTILVSLWINSSIYR